MFSQSEVLHSNLSILEKKIQNVLENGQVNRGPGRSFSSFFMLEQSSSVCYVANDFIIV